MSQTIKLIAVLFLVIIFPSIVSAEYNYTLGLDIETAFDDNPTFQSDYIDTDKDGFVASFKPWINFHWILDKSDLKLSAKYYSEIYPDNSDLDNHDSYLIEALWNYKVSRSFSFVFNNILDVSGFGSDYIDRPGAREDYFDYSAFPGIFINVINNGTLHIDGIWRKMTFDNFDNNDFAVMHGENWEDTGFKISGEYEVIPEMGFVVGFSKIDRDFVDYEAVPAIAVSDAYFGFKTILTMQTQITLKGKLFHFDYDGVPPRHTEGDYNNYGITANIAQPLGEKGKLEIDGYSVFKLSDKAVRLFYRDVGVDINVNWKFSDNISAKLWIQHDKLEYSGMEIEFDETVFKSGMSIDYSVNEWIDFSIGYSNYSNNSTMDGMDIDGNRFSAVLSLVLPEH